MINFAAILRKRKTYYCGCHYKSNINFDTICENVRRMAEKAGCQVQVEELEDEFKLTVTK